MKRAFAIVAAIAAVTLAGSVAAKPAHHAASRPEWAIVIHGGAGTIAREHMTPELEKAYREAMAKAVQIGSDVLKRGGSAEDAIEAVIQVFEDDPKFNAGRGAVFTAAGRNELDAAIMDGATMKAGSVAGVTRTRHPISLARAVMEKSPHVMLIGDGADTFAKEQGLEQVDPSFFFTERRWKELERELTAKHMPIPARPAGAPAPSAAAMQAPLDEHKKFGTVGVVALDKHGNIAAGTSTGGTTGKQWARVGDTPIIGAGTYASNQSCGVSATGTGEYFIRLTVAREICALVQYKHMSLQAAADEVIQKRLSAIKGDGGIVALTPDGQMAWSFNTSGMYRAKASSRSKPVIAIFKNEP